MSSDSEEGVTSRTAHPKRTHSHWASRENQGHWRLISFFLGKLSLGEPSWVRTACEFWPHHYTAVHLREEVLVGEVGGVWSKRLVWVLVFTVLGNQELLVPRGCPLSWEDRIPLSSPSPEASFIPHPPTSCLSYLGLALNKEFNRHSIADVILGIHVRRVSLSWAGSNFYRCPNKIRVLSTKHVKIWWLWEALFGQPAGLPPGLLSASLNFLHLKQMLSNFPFPFLLAWTY